MVWVMHEGKAYKVVDIDDDGYDPNNDSLCLRHPPFLSYLNPFANTDELWVRRGDVKCYYENEVAAILEEHWNYHSMLPKRKETN